METTEKLPSGIVAISHRKRVTKRGIIHNKTIYTNPELFDYIGEIAIFNPITQTAYIPLTSGYRVIKLEKTKQPQIEKPKKGDKMQTYQAVVEYQRKEATVKYTSKPYNTQKEALTDLNQELKRALKKEQTITAAYVTAEAMPQEVVEMLMGGVMELADQEAQKCFDKKVKELTKTLKAIRGEELGFMGHVVTIKKGSFEERLKAWKEENEKLSKTFIKRYSVS